MTSEQWQEAKRLYEAAIDLPQNDQIDFLNTNSANEEVRAMVLRMFSNRSRISGFLERPPLAEIEDDTVDVTEAVGRRVGPYLLLHEIGRGGMGVVYLASRDDDVFKKQVAIKLLWPGFPGDKERFHRERQILAALNHHSIAWLLDGGVTPEGWQYIVMEYIKGQSITDYCNQQRLSITERLKLFREVCAVVEYAHQNLVIHRDLKPSNIFVTETGAVKLLDFGIAKLINYEDQSAFLFSLPGNWMMTPEYASPEQLAERTVTTLSDVYSLGVVLYELLTSQRPYHFPSRSPEAAARIIAETEPEPPSRIVLRPIEDKSQRHTLEGIGAHREGHPEKLRNRIRGDLDNILLMALRREPEKRYRSVAQLSDDIGRHLNGEPVIARKLTLTYRADKFIRRHRAAVLTSLLVVLALLAGLVSLNIRSQRAEAEARHNRRLLYAAHMQQAGEAWADGNLRRVGELLNLHKPGINSDDDAWRGFEWHCLWHLLHREKSALESQSSIWALAFTQDGKSLLTGQFDGKIEIWDSHTGKPQGVFGDQKEWIYSMVLSPDGKSIVTGGQKGRVRIWDFATRRVLMEIPAHNSRVWVVALSPDGQTLATGGEDRNVKLWKVATGQLLYRINYQTSIRSIRFSPDGSLLAVGSGDTPIKLWEVKSGRKVGSFNGNTKGLLALSFSPNGKLLAAGGRDNMLRVWNVANKKLLRALSGHVEKINAIAFLPDGKTIVSASTDHTIRLWNISTGSQLGIIETEGGLWPLALASDGKTLAGADPDSLFTALWDVEKISLPSLIGPTDETVQCFALSPDGSTLVTGEVYRLVFWDWQSGRKIATHKDIGGIRSVEFSPDGRLLAVATTNRPHFETRVELRDSKNGKILRTFNGHTKLIIAATFSPDGRTLATSSEDQTIKLWDVATGEERMILKGHTSYLRRIAFSPDGKKLASGAYDNTVKIWDVTTGKEIQALVGHKGAVEAVKFSPDGKTIASGSRDFTVKFWDTATGRELQTLRGHGEVVNSVTFSPDGKRLASGGSDRTVRLWDVETGIEVLKVKGHTGQVMAVGFTPDGKTLTSAGWDKTVRLWRSTAE